MTRNLRSGTGCILVLPPSIVYDDWLLRAIPKTVMSASMYFKFMSSESSQGNGQIHACEYKRRFGEFRVVTFKHIIVKSPVNCLPDLRI